MYEVIYTKNGKRHGEKYHTYEEACDTATTYERMGYDVEGVYDSRQRFLSYWRYDYSRQR